MMPNRVNRTLLATMENRQTKVFVFSSPWNTLPEMASNEAGSFCSPTNQDLADIFGRADLHSWNVQFGDFLAS